MGDTWWAQWGTDNSTRMAFPAMRTTNGTFPAGSMWTRNPIPACESPGGGDAKDRGEGGSWLGAKPCSKAGFKGSVWEYAQPEGTQFPPPGGFPSKLTGLTGDKYLYGFGNNNGGRDGTFQFSIVDQVQIPADLDAGAYVLSFRYDCEQTPQVWNSCANVRIGK